MHAEMWAEPPARRAALPQRRSRSCGRTRSACSSRSCGPSSRAASGSTVTAQSRRSAARTPPSSRELWDEMTEVRRSRAGCAMVTAEQVWAALEEIPDPEIPVISLVDLGVIRDVSVDGERVRVEFTPTFLGCPALEAMKRALEEKVTALGGEPDVEVIPDDSWSTDRITPAGPREAPRRGLRAAGPARRRRRRRSCSCSRKRSAARTAARPRRGSRTSSARRRAARSAAATSCRQPFEQFKTI